jgi:hypothetical protein
VSNECVEVGSKLGKLTICMSRPSEDEIKRFREELEHHSKIYKVVKETGEWWRLWEAEYDKDIADPQLRNFIYFAIHVLKEVFDHVWFRDVLKRGHPIMFYFLAPNPYLLGKMASLALALHILRQHNKLSELDIKMLRNPDGFISKVYEFIVLAYLLLTHGGLQREFELGVSGGRRPDVKVGDLYIEIKALEIADDERRRHEVIDEEIREALEPCLHEISGVLVCDVDLGNPQDIEELVQRVTTAKEILSNTHLEEGVKEISRDSVRVAIKYVPHQQIKAISINITNYGNTLALEFYRIVRKLAKVAKQAPGDAPLIAIIKPSIPLPILVTTNGENVARSIFSSALHLNPKVMQIKELWIDLTELATAFAQLKAENSLIEQLAIELYFNLINRVFVKLSNPFFQKI